MRIVCSPLATLVVALAAAAPLAAQSEPSDHQVTVDASYLGVNVGFAVRRSAHTSIGASVGLGGNWINYMALSGAHFAEAGGLSYEGRDGRTGKELLDVFRGSIFLRRDFDGGRQLDVGLKASGFAHFDSSDDEPGGGSFVGAGITGMWWKWRALRLGSEIDVGRYSEGAPELGVNVAPLLVRLSF
jgi:hypothetical protein